jgi:hypothetical protein
MMRDTGRRQTDPDGTVWGWFEPINDWTDPPRWVIISGPTVKSNIWNEIFELARQQVPLEERPEPIPMPDDGPLHLVEVKDKPPEQNVYDPDSPNSISIDPNTPCYLVTWTSEQLRSFDV